MKISKSQKNLFVVISVIIIVCSAIGGAASAMESEQIYTYEIPLVNISHGASSAMLFAVNASIEDAEAGNVVVTYTYYVGAEQKNATAKYSEELTANANLGMPVFYTVGISPKDQAEPLTVEAHRADAPENFKPLYYSTSVGKYLYAKLYRDGFINAETENGKRLAKMYLAQIEYVSTCQDALWNAENPEDERKLLNTYNYVSVTDGVISATGNSHDLVSDGVVALTYTGSNASKVGWRITTYNQDGTSSADVVTSNTLTVSGHSVITPCLDSDVITFEDYEVNTSLDFGSD